MEIPEFGANSGIRQAALILFCKKKSIPSFINRAEEILTGSFVSVSYVLDQPYFFILVKRKNTIWKFQNLGLILELGKQHLFSFAKRKASLLS